MVSGEIHPVEDRFDEQLEACEHALTVGEDPGSTIIPGLGVAPAAEGRLLKCMSAVQRLKKRWPGRPRPEVAAPAAVKLPSSLGRFQIRRELGRGAHGIVFLASDSTLGRDVALKLPRSEVMLTADSVERFQKEARAAAALHHPNVVPIYEAGSVGPVCYIAYAYCPGVTLADWLKQSKDVVPPSDAATLLASVADGVEHAHHNGVLHRDLKPSNVLLSFDRTPAATDKPSEKLRLTDAVPHITDFGLAKLVEGDSAQTHSGTIVGTPGYMAPEQARSKRGEVGVGADVYSLGAILYELLTGRPPFQGDSPLDTLMLLQSAEPVPPSRLRWKVPRDLETICLKCLEKEPSRRYATAAALAADLRRFLAHEPILARPVGLVGRMVRWARREPRVAGLVAAIFLVFLAGFIGVFWQWRRAEEQADMASRRETEARRSELKAKADFERARQAVESLAQFGEKLSSDPASAKIGRDTLERALTFYESFLEDDSADPALRHTAALACLKAGGLQTTLGQFQQAERDLNRGIEILQDLHKQFPDDTGYQKQLASGCRGLGLALFRRKQADPAISAFQRAVALLEKLIERDPSDLSSKDLLSNSLANLAAVYTTRKQWDDAVPIYDRIIAVRRQRLEGNPRDAHQRLELALCVDDLAYLNWSRNRLADAETGCREALQIRADVSRQNPNRVDNKYYLARSHHRLALILFDADPKEGVEQTLAEAIRLLEDCVQASPNNYGYHQDLVTTRRRMLEVLWAIGRRDEARKLEQPVQSVLNRFVRAFPDQAGPQNDIAWHLANSPNAEARDPKRATVYAQKIVDAAPDSASYWNTAGAVAFRRGDWNAALAALNKAIAREPAGSCEDFFFLAMTHAKLGNRDEARTWYEKAVQRMRTERFPNQLELERFQAEAAKLIE